MKNEKLTQISQKGLTLFDKIAKAYAYNNIPILMADHLPQRGGILSEFVSHGGRAYIAGGVTGQQYFKNVPQYPLSYDTFTQRDESSITAIAECFPTNIASGIYATFCYVPLGDNLWQKAIDKHMGGRTIATSEQNFRSYFEEKTNLGHILKTAGLEKNMIPTTVLRNSKPLSDLQAELLYQKLASSDGRVVIQRCGEGNTEKGGGKSTEIVGSLEEFKEIVSADRDCYLKIATFISGHNSNLSLCVGNTLPARTMLGSAKGALRPDESRFSNETLQHLLDRGKDMGLSEDNIVVNVQPATLKVVGDPQLTASVTNGVGNQLNYNFPPEVMDEIFSMGEKVGTLMALCGKVGMCGLDLIITKEGHVYVNELNDRQQGPTESASLNNEANGLPGIHRESFIMNYGDLKNPEIVDYLQDMHAHSREIYDESSKIPSPFYIKVCTKEDGYAKTTITPGDYTATKDDDGKTHWDLTHSKELDATPEVDIEKDSVIRINTVSAKVGDFVPKDSQFLRLNGIATPENAPFVVDENGISVLAEQWREPIEALYQEILQKEPVQLESASQDQSGVVAFSPISTTQYASNESVAMEQ